MISPAQAADNARKQLRGDYLILALCLIGVIVLYYSFGTAAAVGLACLTLIYYLLVARKSAENFLRRWWELELSGSAGQTGSVQFLRGRSIPSLKELQQILELPPSPAKGIVRQAITFTGDSLTLTVLDLNYPCPLADKTLAVVSGCCLQLKSERIQGPHRIYRNAQAFSFQVVPEGYVPFGDAYLIKGVPQSEDASLLENLGAVCCVAVLVLGNGYASVLLPGKLLGAYHPSLKVPITEAAEKAPILPELSVLCNTI